MLWATRWIALYATTQGKPGLVVIAGTGSVCLGKNERLYQLGRELINHVESPEGFLKALRAEPFTQIKRVELENIFQDYRDELDLNRIKPISSRSDSPS